MHYLIQRVTEEDIRMADYNTILKNQKEDLD